MMNPAEKKNTPVRVVTGPRTRFSYCHLAEPRSFSGGAPRYSLSAIIPKDDTETVEKIHEAILETCRRNTERLAGDGPVPAPEELKTPLRDGDLEKPGNPDYAGCWYINASSERAPGIVDENAKTMLNRSDVYSGCYGRVSLTFYAYNRDGNRGIACRLNNVQKLRDGEPLGGSMSAEAEFGGQDALLKPGY